MTDIDVAAFVSTQEGSRLVVYDDATGKPIVPGYHVVGHPTIGNGRALDVEGITTEEEKYLLSNDLDKLQSQLATYSWFQSLDEVRQCAIVSMAYQLGLTGLLHFPKMLAALGAKEWTTAKAEALDSAWAKQTPARANMEAEMLLSGLMPIQ